MFYNFHWLPLSLATSPMLSVEPPCMNYNCYPHRIKYTLLLLVNMFILIICLIFLPVKRLSSATLELTVNLTVLPSYSKHILITDELCLNFTDRNRSHLAIQDVWIKDRSTERPLARVYLKMGKPGYQAINLGSILADWLKNSQSTGSLIIEIKPGIMTAKEIISLNPSPYLVAYTNRLNVLSVPKPVKCHSQVISVPTGEHMLPRNWRTKICSPLTDITFPFNASSVFDVGQAVRNYLSSNPRLISSKVLRNPSCCHALRSGSMNLRTPEGGVWLENAKITECGCQEV